MEIRETTIYKKFKPIWESFVDSKCSIVSTTKRYLAKGIFESFRLDNPTYKFNKDTFLLVRAWCEEKNNGVYLETSNQKSNSSGIQFWGLELKGIEDVYKRETYIKINQYKKNKRAEKAEKEERLFNPRKSIIRKIKPKIDFEAVDIFVMSMKDLISKDELPNENILIGIRDKTIPMSEEDRTLLIGSFEEIKNKISEKRDDDMNIGSKIKLPESSLNWNGSIFDVNDRVKIETKEEESKDRPMELQARKKIMSNETFDNEIKESGKILEKLGYNNDTCERPIIDIGNPYSEFLHKFREDKTLLKMWNLKDLENYMEELLKDYKSDKEQIRNKITNTAKKWGFRV